jgi:V8-like Glu-specific endopeptidase
MQQSESNNHFYSRLISINMWILLIIVNSLLLSMVHSDITISHDVPVPRGMTRNDFLKSIVEYWTPERMATAQPKDVLYVDQASLGRFWYQHESGAQSNDSLQSIPAMSPTENVAQSSLSPESRSLVPRISGKVYFVMNGRNYLCSGSVVAASNRDAVITAGHCVYDYDLKIWASSFIFVPQYTSGSAPYGSWVARHITTLTSWAYYQDYNSDVGMVLMHPNTNGQHIQQFTGGLGIKWNGGKSVYIHAFGYPKNMANGEMMSACTASSTASVGISGFNGVQIVCGMTGGASGGPWIQEYNTVTMLGYQMCLTSFLIQNRPGYIFGPYFNTAIYNLYTQYENQ